MASRNRTFQPLITVSRVFASILPVCGLVLALSVVLAERAAATEFNVIHTFRGKADGQYPQAGLTEAGGTLYGTTFGSIGENLPSRRCSKTCGNQYDLVGSQLTTEYFFGAGSDGAFPTGEVVVDNGTVYGTTELGGGTACNGLGCGTVFSTAGQGADQVFEFCRPQYFPICANGAFPHAGPIIGSDGNLYGTTSLGGLGIGYQCDNNFGGCGTVYMITPDLATEKVLYSFCPHSGCPDGAIPYGKLLQDASGNFYGTTQFGGAFGQGTIFELQPSQGTYTESVLYSFCYQGKKGCPDGAIPEAGLVADGAGNLYGTASAGGGGTCEGSGLGCGAVFELTASGNYNVLHAFAGGSDGALPQASLVLDTNDNLYGTTEKGGKGQHCSIRSIGCGTVFMLAPDGTETILHTFGQIKPRTDGAQPEGALLLYKGFVYGATRVEGDKDCDCGTLFKVAIGK
ncbi:MAG TPA: choice-of-anchor tandem repeat GloVer-containing protein [Rhizomicrobium sp.]|jgi:uncharacterized repeat protein (TIGR03803 family)